MKKRFSGHITYPIFLLDDKGKIGLNFNGAPVKNFSKKHLIKCQNELVKFISNYERYIK